MGPSAESERKALEDFEQQRRAYEEHRKMGGIDLAETAAHAEDPTLGDLGIHNRAMARASGIHAHSSEGRKMKVPRVIRKKRRKSAKAARRRNRG